MWEGKFPRIHIIADPVHCTVIQQTRIIYIMYIYVLHIRESEVMENRCLAGNIQLAPEAAIQWRRSQHYHHHHLHRNH